MLMYATVCKNKGNIYKNFANFITCGIARTRSLRGWYNNNLTEQQRIEIFCAVKENGDMLQEDAVYTLTLAIIGHFTI